MLKLVTRDEAHFGGEIDVLVGYEHKVQTCAIPHVVNVSVWLTRTSGETSSSAWNNNVKVMRILSLLHYRKRTYQFW